MLPVVSIGSGQAGCPKRPKNKEININFFINKKPGDHSLRVTQQTFLARW
jgi:hypothetical protein